MKLTNRLRAISALLISCLLLAACETGDPPVPPIPSSFLVYSSGDTIGISAPPGSADTGTTVEIISGGSGSGMADPDGGVAFKATASAGLITLSYIKSNQILTSDAAVQPLSSRVTKPLFSTGSAPNDMELADGSLFVANSLDNTVVRYSFSGAVEDTATFEVGASPSYLSTSIDRFGQHHLHVITNGSRNTLWDYMIHSDNNSELGGLDNPNIANLITNSAAFAGPGKPAITQAQFGVYVPRADILEFGATISYGDSTLESLYPSLSTLAGGPLRHNGVFAIAAPDDTFAYFVNAGELQYDASFRPHAESDSYISVAGPNHELSEPAESINLGRVGAATLAITADGTFGYVGTLVSGNVYKVNLETRSVLRGETNPLHLTDEFTYIADLEFIPGTNLLLATSFNTDELYVIDTATDTVSPAPYPGPFDLSLDPQLLAGASAVEVDASVNPPVAYVLYSVANAVAKVELLP